MRNNALPLALGCLVTWVLVLLVPLVGESFASSQRVKVPAIAVDMEIVHVNDAEVLLVLYDDGTIQRVGRPEQIVNWEP